MIPVQQFRSRVKPVRPDDGSCFVVDSRLPEVVGIAQGLAKRSVKQERAVDFAHHAVVEGDSQVAVVDRLDVSDSKHCLRMLRQRFDRNERLERLGARPIVGELRGVQPCPLPDESQRSRRQCAVDDPQGVKLDLDHVFAVLSVEVRWRVVRAVHPDHYPVEGGQTRHDLIVGDLPADPAFTFLLRTGKGLTVAVTTP